MLDGEIPMSRSCRIDWAKQVRWLLDELRGEAFRLARRLEIHHTPKHGSWLDIGEPGKEFESGNASRNRSQKGVTWHFTAGEVRTKLKHLCTVLEFWMVQTTRDATSDLAEQDAMYFGKST